MDIVTELGLLDKQIHVKFASYSTGAQTFMKRGVPVIDMELPENNLFLPTLEKAFRLTTDCKPQVVVAHEEFAAIAAAKLANVPAIFISAWLPAAGTIAAESLVTASALLVIDSPGIFPIPPGIRGQVCYSGPITRKLKYTRVDRLALRREMGMEDDALAILVVPGGWAGEERASIADTVLSAFFALKQTPKRLLWLAGKDAESLSARTKGMKGVHILPFVDPVERIISACDLVITKGTRGITMDAASAGVPTISLSPGLNPMDDLMVPRIRTNIALNARAVDGVILQHYIEEIISKPPVCQPAANNGENTKLAARLLLDCINAAINNTQAAESALPNNTITPTNSPSS